MNALALATAPVIAARPLGTMNHAKAVTYIRSEIVRLCAVVEAYTDLADSAVANGDTDAAAEFCGDAAPYRAQLARLTRVAA